ncbi:MAG: hypothetical protein M1821_008628 [Bathelium mastoideum]|nr:MAG: hypothetical protein M1821_008628 [Bathelium mastoideum]KAI9687247.1 MAG: hypothetical protein M1822_002290 [Bathelium mastoideum]
MAPSPAAGRTSGAPRTPTKLGGKKPSGTPSGLAQQATQGSPSPASGRKPAKLGAKKSGESDSPQLPSRPEASDVGGQAEGAAEEAQDTAEDVKEQAGEEEHGVEMKDSSEAPGDEEEDDGLAGKVEDVGDDAKEGLQEAEPKPVEEEEEAEDTVGGAREEGEDIADDTTEKAGETAEDTEDTTGESAGDAASGVGGQARGLAGKAGGLAGRASQDPTGAVGDAASQAQDTAGDAVEGAQDTAGDVAEGAEDTAGDAADQAGEAVNGVKDAAEDATGQQVPDLSILKGLEVNDDGDVKDNSGNTIGKLVEGDAEDLSGYPIGDDGEILDDDGDLVGRVELTPEKAQELTDQAKGAADGALPDGLKDKLPGLDTLKGLSPGLDGNIYNDEGDVVGQLTDGNPNDLKDSQFNEKGEILDEAGNVIGKAKLHPEFLDEAKQKLQESGQNLQNGLPEDLQDQLPGLDILNGLECGADGNILNADGEVVGQLTEGDAEDLAGMTFNEDGEILDEDGDVVGRAEIHPDYLASLKQQLQEQTDGAQDAIPEELRGITKLSILDGLQCSADGNIYNADGELVGRLTEGNAEELEGYTFNENGEILDEDGDVVGRAELHPDYLEGAKGKLEEAGVPAEQIEQQLAQATGDAPDVDGAVDGVADGDVDGAVDGAVDGDVDEAVDGADGIADGVPEIDPELPGLDALEGRELNEEGQIVDDDGNVLANLAEGDIEKVKGLQLNDQGEVVDEEGNVIGRVNLADGAQEKLATAAKFLPFEPIKILEGRKVNKKGKILDDEGEEIGHLVEGDPAKCAGKAVDENGNVLDKDGKVIGKMELTPGDAADEAAEALKNHLIETGELSPKDAAGGALGQIPVQILEGLKVNKKGQVLNADGDPIGELAEGDPKECAGKTIDAEGNVLDKQGNAIGKVKVIDGEAAQEAASELRERLGDAAPEELQEAGEEATLDLPGLDILDGLKVNKKGQILDEDGEPIGELIDGDLAECAGKKCNDQGEVLDKDGNIIGRVRTLPKEAKEAEEEAEEQVEEEADSGLPPLSILEGLTCNKQGKLLDDDGNIRGELIEGDAKKLAKLGVQCDEEGQFWDTKGHVIGRAQTVPVEDKEEDAPFAGLEGLQVKEGGVVADKDGNIVGQVVEGDPAKLIGLLVDEDGDIINKKGTVIGHAERIEQPEYEPPDLSILEGRTVNKSGYVVGDDGVPIGRLVEGDVKNCAGKELDAEGQIWNDKGRVIGRCEVIPEDEREKPEGPFAGLVGLRVGQNGQVIDEDENVVGEVVEGNPKRLVGMAVDEDGDITDRYGNVKGHAEPIPEEAEVDLSILNGLTLNKQGFLVNEDGLPVGKLVEGDPKELAGRKADEQGLIYNDTGKAVGRCEVIPPDQRVMKQEGPFAGLEGLHVNKEGMVEDENGNIVGEVVEGNVKRLVGLPVDEDGDISDKYGNTKGHAEPWEAPEEQAEDLSALAGCTVNKAGNVVDSNGTIIGRVAEGDVKDLIGAKVDGEGQIWDNAGKVIGRAELVHGMDSSPDGPFEGFEDITVAKDGTVVTPDGTIVGRLVEGDPEKLVGHRVDADGEIADKNGNKIGQAERWSPEEKERRISPMSGRRVNKEGEVRDEDGNVIGRLTAGDLQHCIGEEIDDNGNVVDQDGNKIGECTLLENIVEEEEEEEETEEQRKQREENEIANKMANICQQTLERVQPVCHQITEYIDAADKTPREELDEEQLVDNVKPLIEEGGRILQECNGSLRGLDPDGHIAAEAKGRAGTREASPEQYRLADLLKELTGTVVTTIDNAKKKIADMPHAKKKLNPLWALLTEPLFQILAAVGLLLSGVLGLVGKLLNGLGLGGLVNGLLGGLGIDKLLGGLGLGSVSEALGFGGKKKEKKSGGGGSGLPLIGGMFGGKK